MPAQEHTCLIVSCGTIGAQVGVGHEVAKLIRVDSHLPRTRRVGSISAGPRCGGGVPETLKTWSAPFAHLSREVRISSCCGAGGPPMCTRHWRTYTYASEACRGALICVIEESEGAIHPRPLIPSSTITKILTTGLLVRLDGGKAMPSQKASRSHMATI